MSKQNQIGVLFVCMGNICRSPTAEGVFRQQVINAGLESIIAIDSAGTHSYHIGSPPDQRSQMAAKKRNIDLSTLRGRQFTPLDFDRFDYILAMDQANFDDMLAQNSSDKRAELTLLLDYSIFYPEKEVPDPYYGGDNGFEHVLDLIEDAGKGLLQHICKYHQL